MSYSVTCDCGSTLSVDATQAGSPVPCSCGRTAHVPSLSMLRQSAAEQAYPRSTIETIVHMIECGELPLGDTCAVSGRPTIDTILLHIQCERIWHRGSSADGLGGGRVFCLVLFGWLYFLVAWLESIRPDRPPDVLGRNTTVEVPLRVCVEFDKRLKRFGQRKLKKLLRRVPVYATLLDEYPSATISISDEASSTG